VVGRIRIVDNREFPAETNQMGNLLH
jgi:hypothetical protein